MQWKELILSSLIIAACLIFIYFFPAQNSAQEYTVGLFFFLLLPVSYIKFVLKQNLSSFGFSLGDKKEGFIWAGIMLLASLLAGYFLLNYTSFKTTYEIPSAITDSFGLFLFYELILANVFLFLQCVFFRGFVLFSFEKYFGWKAAVISFLLFLLAITLPEGLNWNIAPAIIASLAGTTVAYRSRSFLYAYATEFLFIFFLDAYFIHILNQSL